MSLTNQIGAYTDCFELFDKALADEKGVRIPFGEYANAKLFQMRMNQARALDRQQSRRIHPPTDPRYDKSPYDIFVVRNPIETAEKDGFWIYVERQGIRLDEAESLSEIEDEKRNPSGTDQPSEG